MKTKLILLFLFLSITAYAAPGIRISDYPNMSSLTSNKLFVIADPGVVATYNSSFGQLTNQVLTSTELSNKITAVAGTVSSGPWLTNAATGGYTNQAGVYMLNNGAFGYGTAPGDYWYALSDGSASFGSDKWVFAEGGANFNGLTYSLFPAARGPAGAFLSDNGSGTLSWSVNGSGLTNLNASALAGTVSSAQLFGAQGWTNGTVQPFEPSKTYLVMLGDSITIGCCDPTNTNPWSYANRITNLVHWRGLKFYTNTAKGGETFSVESNAFFSTVLPLLPSSITGGTNVIVSMAAGCNDLNSGVGWPELVTWHQGFANALHARGYIFVRPTIMYRTNFTAPVTSNLFVFNNWVARSSNYVDRVPDFFRVLPDNDDTNYFSTDGIHPLDLGHAALAEEWDAAVRLGTKTRPYSMERTGRNWEWHDSNGALVAKLYPTNNNWSQIRAGKVNYVVPENTGGYFGSAHTDAPGLIAQGATTTSVVMQGLASDGSINFQVFGNGSVLAGASGVESRFLGSLKLQGGSGSGVVPLLKFRKSDFNPIEWEWGITNSDGSLYLHETNYNIFPIQFGTNGTTTFGGGIKGNANLFATDSTITAGNLEIYTSFANALSRTTTGRQMVVGGLNGSSYGIVGGAGWKLQLSQVAAGTDQGNPASATAKFSNPSAGNWFMETNLVVSQNITATNAFLMPTNYVAANFAPTAGMVKIVASNGVLYKVTQLSTNLLSQDIP